MYHDGHPVRGMVRFTPERLWVVQAGVHWATLAPEVILDHDGTFCVEVTPTNTDEVPWYYRAETPAGVFRLTVPYINIGWLLKDLIDEHHPGSRAEDRR